MRCDAAFKAVLSPCGNFYEKPYDDLRRGLGEAWASRWTLIILNFVIIAVLSAQFFWRPSAGSRHTNKVGPAAIALILHSCYWLAGPRIRPGAAIAVVCPVVNAKQGRNILCSPQRMYSKRFGLFGCC